MAAPKSLRLVASEPLGARGRLLTLESEADIGFRGGQFFIVDTGLKKEDGAPLKRCYSLLSPSAEQRRIELAVQRVGPGSSALQDLEPGVDVAYSGPWGKLLSENQPGSGPALVVATDTGITAALGLVCGAEFRSRLEETTLLWFDHADDALLTEEDARHRLPKSLGCFERRELPAVGSPDRGAASLAALDEVLDAGGCEPSARWLVGDGDVLTPVLARLTGRPGAETAPPASIEYFFHKPEA